MRMNTIALVSGFVLILLLLSFPGSASATQLTVSKVCSDPTVTTCFTSIQAAINAANPPGTIANDTILIEPGVYTESIVLKDHVFISGRETARTVIQNPGTGVAITASGLTDVNISKLTIVSTAVNSVGIQTTNASGTHILISNCVFFGARTGNGIVLDSLSNGSITNSTFFQNNIALTVSSNIPISDNIFSFNNTAILAQNSLILSIVNNNDFDHNGNDGFTYDHAISTNIPNNTIIDFVPDFVSTVKTPPDMDLHLQADSACCIITSSTGSQIGAFGGSGADNIPFPISNVASTVTSTTIQVTWSPNKSFQVSGYKVYYGTVSPTVVTDLTGTGATEGSSPIDVPQSTTPSQTLSGLASLVTTTPASPMLASIGFGNMSLTPVWTADPDATGYKIYFSTSAFDQNSLPANPITVNGQAVTSQTIPNLTNLQLYYIGVSAIAQTRYFIAVTAFNNPGGPESDISNVVSQPVGTTLESGISTVLSERPEAAVPTPNLPKKGCFIATAAYGYYSAPQVQVLREFRDRYLVTNAPGRAFVDWYYRYGPIGADYITTHAWLKPVVRVALLPALAGALFMIHTPSVVKIVVILAICCLSFYLLRRRQVQSGGVR